MRCVAYQRSSLAAIAATPTEVQDGMSDNRMIVPLSMGRGSSLGNTLAEDSVITINHNLGVRPRFISFFMRCVIAEQGFSIGDEVEVCLQSAGSSGTDANTTIEVSATQIKIYLGGVGATIWQPVIVNKTSRIYFAVQMANWVVDVYWMV